MNSRQRPWPRQWLMTDERLGDRLWDAIARLPDGESGIVFRHYATPEREREAFGLTIAEACRARSIVLAVAGDSGLAQRLGADLVHNPSWPPGDMPFSLPVHTFDEAARASALGAAVVFVSPVRPTRSHPDRVALGPSAAAQMAEVARVPAIALGGMNARAFAALPERVFYGWAGIDAWLSPAD
jgi:thiamine-phosphate pyrophosphorylase